ncbi:DUF2306 domain-containing protein [Paenibacillus guangzhouensis]|uniref:DUF2306 domain-containing protein n=1 Tax=Paenibacillus guangzhouensis TaxID=1473112 RepID=UPI00126754EE|nr:DUF2306 domain-containing protein [Paenibacillus guangzhouensis]
MQKTKTFLVFLCAILIVLYTVIQYGFFDVKFAGLVQFKLQNPDFHVTPWVYFLYAHIVTGALALLIGPFQIFRKQRDVKSRNLHRRLGMVYVISIFISGIVNIYLSLYATAGWVAQVGFIGLDLAWMMTTYMAVAKIMRQDIAAHRNWMLRSYALTFAAVMLRIYLGPLSLAFGDFELAYRVTAWLCWVPNLIIIEMVIRKRTLRNE